MGSGDWSACECSLKKRGKLLRERASAKEGFEPATWEADINMLNRATIKCRHTLILLLTDLCLCQS